MRDTYLKCSKATFEDAPPEKITETLQIFKTSCEHFTEIDQVVSMYPGKVIFFRSFYFLVASMIKCSY